MTINWSESKLTEAKKEISTLELTQEKTENVKFYGEVMSNYIPLSKELITGFILLSVNEWENNHPDLNFAVEARGPNAMNAANELNVIIKRRLKSMVKDKSQHTLVDDAINSSIKKFAELGASGVPK